MEQRLRCGDVDTAISHVEGSARRFSVVVNISARMRAMRETVLLVAKLPFINVNVERLVHFEPVPSPILGVRILAVKSYLA